MKIKSLSFKIFILMLVLSIMPVIIFVSTIYIAGLNGKVITNSSIISLGIYVAFLSLTLFYFCFSSLVKLWKNIRDEYKNGIIAIQRGDYDYKIALPNDEELKAIEKEYAITTDKLKENKKEIENQAREIYTKNMEIQQTNMELEASYGQLQATMNQLNDSEQKYYSLVKNITDIVCVIKLDGNIYFINDVVKYILGYTREEIEGKNIKDLLKPEVSEMLFKKVSNTLQTKNAITLEMEMVSKNNQIVLTEATLTNFIYDGEVIGIQAILRNITEKKKMEQQIVNSYKELATINNISRKLNATLDINVILNLIVQEICRVLKNPLCTLGLLDEERKNVIPKSYAGNYFTGVINNAEDFGIYPITHPLFDKVFDSDETMIKREVNDIPILAKINETKNEKEKIKELIMVPISNMDKNMGVLSVGTTEKFNSRHKSLLSSIANNAAIAIENAELYNMAKKNFIKTVNALIAAIEAKDKYTQGHSCRVSRFAVILAKKIGLAEEQIDEIRIAGILHDVGKIGIPDAILNKPDRLTSDEYELVKKHPAISNKILEPVGLSDRAQIAISQHHERWDGKGYPYGLSHEKLSIEAQIITVADALDAMTSTRAYRKAMTEEEAVAEIIKGRSSQFGPQVVDALYDLFKGSKEEIFDDGLL